MRDRTLSVTQLNEYIKGVFEDELVLHSLHVTGEVFEYKQTNTAVFVTLRGKDALLSCVCFGKSVPLAIGDRVSLFGDVKFYERSGKVSFVFQSAAKIGAGDLLAEFNALRDKLQADGLFDNKQPLVAPIRKIAVVTSETGAVIHDFMQTVHRKRKFTDIHLYPSTVQGKFAATEIEANLRHAYKNGYDALVLMRGGGSGDDLSVFNDERLVRVLAKAPFPVISAIGHETDFTLCDFAASVRAGTPSMAGEYISRLNEAFFDRLDTATHLLTYNMLKLYGNKTNQLCQTAAAISCKSEIKIERAYAKLQRLSLALSDSVKNTYNTNFYNVRLLADRITNAVREKSMQSTVRLQTSAAKLNGNNPLRILSMGYAKLYSENGQSVSFDTLHIGDTFDAVCSDGKLSAQVIKKQSIGGHNGT